MRFVHAIHFQSLLAALVVIGSGAPAPAEAGARTVLYQFAGGATGRWPDSGVTRSKAGFLYGTTWAGGADGLGLVYELSPPSGGKAGWTRKTVYEFRKTVDGPHGAVGPLLIDDDGALIGRTGSLVYRLSPPAPGENAWRRSVIYKANGFIGTGDIVAGARGVLYAGSATGGARGFGAVIELTPPPTGGGRWTRRNIYSFAGGSDGKALDSGLTLDGAGRLYGASTATFIGGNGGTVFRLTPPAPGRSFWTKTILRRFKSGDRVNGYEPTGGLVVDAAGAVYGTARAGGPEGGGVVFKLTAPPADGEWSEAVLHAFRANDNPGAGLVGGGADLFGDTALGNIFRLTPNAGRTAWSYAVYARGADSRLTIDDEGRLYGASEFGGSGDGWVIRVAP